MTNLPSLYSSGLYPKYLTSAETPSTKRPFQLGQVSGHRDLYLPPKLESEINPKHKVDWPLLKQKDALLQGSVNLFILCAGAARWLSG